MKRALASAAVLLAVGAFVVFAGGAANGNATGTYKIELDNAFGLVTGADFKVAGVPAGTIKAINLDPACITGGGSAACHALVTVAVIRSGFGAFHADAFCQSRPQSLIGEYFIDCNPGSSGRVLRAGSTIPVSHTQSTIAADLLQNVMRMPYRERLTLIINELGAAVASRSGDLQAALARAVPALTESDNLLNLLANDSSTLQSLTRDANTVITALANNSANVQRFITEANNTATDTATQSGNLQLTFQRLPGLLGQLRPAMAKLGTAVTANQPVVSNLDAASGQLHRLFTDLPGFSRSAIPALKSLGQASITGKSAVQAAGPTVAELNRFSQPTPELAQNLAIVLRDLDDRSRAVEPDPRSPGGQGFTGLEALLGYVFNQTLAINTYGPLGHMLAVDIFFNRMCSPYATPATVALALKQYGAKYRQCYSWLGPKQPGVNQTDPSAPSAAVPDPGGAPPGQVGPQTNAAKLTVADLKGATSTGASSSTPPTSTKGASTAPTGAGVASTLPSAAGSATSAAGTSTATTGTPGPPVDVHKTIGQLLSLLGGSSGSPGSSRSSSGSGGSSGAAAGVNPQQLLNYLLAP